MKTCLYRHFDQTGALLYVGISGNPFARTCQHKTTADHFHEITKINIEWFDSREVALVRETEAIKNESPKYNNYNSTRKREILIKRLKAFSAGCGFNRHSFMAAEDRFGSQDAMAQALGVDLVTVALWKTHGLPPNQAVEIERLTNGFVTRAELLPEIFGEVA